MSDNTTPGTVRLHRVLRAPPERVYRAFLDPGALVKWLPPHGFTGTMHGMDARVGGGYRMSFTNLGTGSSHSFTVKYVELVPNERIRHTDTFDAPSLPGEMQVTVTLKKSIVGTELNVVGAADLVLHVGDQGVLHLADATVVDRRVLPCEVGELRVDRDADDFDAALLELVQAVIEGDQLGRADEGEIERVKENDRVLALGFRGQREVADFVVAHDGGCGEIGGLLAN